ncbi:phage portal protein [Luteimonas notoginsengisoli]|uniref:Phage portal protein n=1 Tax=Luteimonas notoginsengisoli TaxID=1578200 RepID=A0ABV7UQ18_9GAMM
MTGSAAIAAGRLRSVIPVDRAQRAIADTAARPVRAVAHEVTRPSRARKLARDWGSGNNIVGMDAKQLRDQARHLERDLDLARNALNVLVQNTCGSGIDVLAAPRKAGGKVDRVLAQEIDALWDEWWDRPEVTKMHDYGRAQQLMARSLFRDGECYYQDIIGPVPFYTHGTRVPYSFEMLEADMLPLDFTEPGRRILQGVERNAWGERVGYWFYKIHPGESIGWNTETKFVPADKVNQLALIDRIHQVRGLSVFASSMSRFEDVKDYEESERIAAKVAASMCAYIKKGQPEGYGQGEGGLAGEAVLENGVPIREMRFTPGAVFDDLLVGEDIGTIATNRPNPNAATWRKEQLRAAAGGIGTSYSSLSLDYNGTYSAQRQELVEKWGGYLMLGEQFIAQGPRKQRQRFIEACLLAGLIKAPRGWTLANVAASTYVRPVMPWIDPLKEAYAKGEAEDRGWASPQQNTLLAGNNPNDVLTETADWNERRAQLELDDAAAVDPAPSASTRTGVVHSMLTKD